MLMGTIMYSRTALFHSSYYLHFAYTVFNRTINIVLITLVFFLAIISAIYTYITTKINKTCWNFLCPGVKCWMIHTVPVVDEYLLENL